MKVSDLGEFGLIDLLAGMVRDAVDNDSSAQQELIIGIGDDAAVWQGSLSTQLATSDSLVQNVHFNLEFTLWEDLGWRAMAANLSDIAAMGGLPRYALVSLSLPDSTDVDNVRDLYHGMISLARSSGVVIAGGNISSAPLVTINITILGDTGTERKQILTRSAAVPGDKIAVTGYLGASAAGLEILKNNIRLDSESAETLKKAFLRPVPRIQEGQLLVEKGVRTAIDISDGLVADLGHICVASKISASIETSLVPVHPVTKKSLGEDALRLALSGGEDYELLFTAPERVISSVRESTSCPVTVIGEITAAKPGEVIIVDENGNTVSLESSGWRHF